jgi:membrane complex biogenesis BtpA family protein
MGLHTPDAAALLRFRRDLGAEQVRVFANVTPEFASPLGSRSVAQRARSAAFSSLVDGILISGMTPGIEPDLGELQEAKDAVGANVPVLCNSGANVKNIRRMLEIADGAIVGSSLKLDGYIWNPVDPARAEAFMRQVGRVREAGQ